jgi:hypothetical protein
MSISTSTSTLSVLDGDGSNEGDDKVRALEDEVARLRAALENEMRVRAGLEQKLVTIEKGNSPMQS